MLDQQLKISYPELNIFSKYNTVISHIKMTKVISHIFPIFLEIWIFLF